MPDRKDGFSGRILVISMLLGATLLGVLAVIYRRTHPPVAPPLPASTGQGVY